LKPLEETIVGATTIKVDGENAVRKLNFTKLIVPKYVWKDKRKKREAQGQDEQMHIVS